VIKSLAVMVHRPLRAAHAPDTPAFGGGFGKPTLHPVSESLSSGREINPATGIKTQTREFFLRRYEGRTIFSLSEQSS